MKKIFFFIILIIMIIVVFAFGLLVEEETVEVSKIYDGSKSSIVLDSTTGRVLYENNCHERMLPASITKILTCITAIEFLKLDDLVFILPEMVNTEGSSIYLQVGDVISVQDLLYGLMLCSGNDAAQAIAYHYSGNPNDFIHLMNKVAKKIGMKNSTFENPSGLDSVSKNYTTAYDMAILTAYAMKNETFREITSTKNYNPLIASEKRMYFNNKHRLIRSGNAIGGKTGYTKASGRTLVSVFKKDDKEIIVVTLSCSDDWNLHLRLSEYGFNVIN